MAVKEVVEVLNETIHDGSNEKSYAIMWDETRGARRANKIASSILKRAEKYMPTDANELNI